MNLKVLYEDNHLIAVFKPAGILTQGDETGDENLMDEVKKYLKEKYKKPGKVFLGLLHRLDRPVSGIILFAKTSKGAARLSEQFRKNEIKKIYHAIVIGRPLQRKGTLTNYLKKDEQNKKAVVVKENEGKTAELDYDVVLSNGKYSLLKIRLKTGRFHQIRAQLACAGLPILGDLKYGAPFALADKSIALCATSIYFKLATKPSFANALESKEISIPLPQEWGMYLG